MLDKICSKILPRINEKVTKLIIDPFCAKHILEAVHYPQLYSLTFVHYQPDTFLRHLLGRTISSLLINQITHLTVGIYTDTKDILRGNEPSIFLAILVQGRRLVDLTLFQQFSRNYLTFSSWNIPHTNSLSSTLTNLTINVNTFDDCLQLLNGWLPSLSTLIILIKKIKHSSLNIDNVAKIVELKCFSLTLGWYTRYYDKKVVPLLRRMVKLEELALQLSVMRTESTYIDGNQLYDDVLCYMPRLKKFIFNIHTYIVNHHIRTDLPSNDAIRNSFIKRGFQSVDSYADDKLIDNTGNCHVYSLPYPFRDFLFMSSCFQGGKFDQVRKLLMFDRRPFEHKLFKIISQDFPYLQKLTILNLKPQENEQDHSSSLITFNHLFKLILVSVHQDYVMQFLSDRKTHLPCLTHLEVEYTKLAIATNYFTCDATRLNCSRIRSLIICDLFVRPPNFDSYFPSL